MKPIYEKQRLAMREAVEQFVDNDLPEDFKLKARRLQVMHRSDYQVWMGALYKKGWALSHWPKEYGGINWSPVERFAMEDELSRHGLPWILPFGVKYVGPVIYTFGTEEQKQRFLPGILSNETFWAQGYSEPNAGSDLASLRTEAVRDGDDYIVNGQKIWTTYAQFADWIFALVKTDKNVRAQDGISFLLIDMKSPGITVKPIDTMDGYRHVNEVWFDSVRVPAVNLVGEAGKGWTYAKFLLKHERTAGLYLGQPCWNLERLKRMVNEIEIDGEQATLLRHRVGELELRFFALEHASYQVLEAMAEGTENGGDASLIKVRTSELLQDITDATVDAMGLAGIAYDPVALQTGGLPPLGPDDAGGLLKNHMFNRAATIFAGSSEVQRQIIAKAVLGL